MKLTKIIKKSGFKMMAVTLMLVVATLSGCSTKKEAQTLKIGVLSDVDSIPFIIAQEKGFLPSNVEITRFTGAQDRDSAFQSKNVDGVISDVLAACLAMSGGFDVRITSQTNGIYKLLVSGQSGIDDISGLKGHSAAMSRNTIIEYTFDAMCSAAGFSGDDVTKEYIPQIPVRLEMLNANQVDSALLPEPFGSSAALSGGVLLKSSADLGINPGVMVFGKEAIDKKKDEIKKLYEAYDKAVDYIQKTNKEEYIDILIEKLGFPENIRDELVLPTYTKAMMPPENEIAAANEWLLNKELIEKALTFKELTEKVF